ALLYAAVAGLLLANTLNARADILAIAAGMNLLVPTPIPLLLGPLALLILALQVWGSYRLIARVFKWLSLALLTYIGAAFPAQPDWGAVARGTFLPALRFDRTFLEILVAIRGDDHLSLPVLLASQPGGGRGGRAGAQAAVAAEGGHGCGVAVCGLGCRRRH